MLERFTERARKVMAGANQEAQRSNHEYIGTEHILLGLARVEEGPAAEALAKGHTGHHPRCRQVLRGALPRR